MLKPTFSFTALLLILLVSTGCFQDGQLLQPKKNLLGLWIGEYQDYYGSKGPLPILLDFKSDGTVYIQDINGEADLDTWSLSGGQLTVDTVNYTIFEHSQNCIRFGLNSVQSFKRVHPEKWSAELESLKADLRNKTFKSPNGIALSFQEEQVFTHRENELEQRCFDFFIYEQYCFMYQFGDIDTCKQGQIGRILQVLDFSPDHFTVYSVANGSRERYEYVDNKGFFEFDQPAAPTFQTCGFGDLYPHRSIIDAHEKGGKFVEDYFFEHLQLEKNSSLDGFFVLKFSINCRGQVGDFSVEGLDRNYQAKEFPKSVKADIFNALEKLDGWLPLESNGNFFDSYKSIIFRFDEGRLTAISP
ncbi:MAG: hypothetical protein AAF598_15485 [Bacteroidota bacterium]